MLGDLLSQWHADLFDPGRIPVAGLAILVTAIIGMITGPLAGNANPALWFFYDRIFGGFGDKMDKKHRPRADLLFRGFLITALGLFLALVIGKFFERLVFEYHYHGLTEALLLSLMLTSGAVWFALLRLYFALEKKQVGEGAYFAISRSTRTNLTVTDDFGITRTGMGFSASSFDKGLVNPVFWYLVGGLPLAVVYSALAALAWRFGKFGFSKGFGAPAQALERLMGFVPSMLAAVLITLASTFTPTAKLHKGIAAWLGHKNRATYEQGGFPLSALAWSLNVSLGGAMQDISGSGIKGEWVGPSGATAQNNHKHLRRALYINVMAHFLFLAALGGAYIWAGRVFG